MPKIKTKEEQKISDDRNYLIGYFIQILENKAREYIFSGYWGIFNDFIESVKRKLSLERSSQGRGFKVGDYNRAEILINSTKEMFDEFREILKPSIVESFLDEIVKKHRKSEED